MRQKLLGTKNNPILLIAPNEMHSWCTFYDNEIESISSEIEFIDNKMLVSHIVCIEYTKNYAMH